MTDDRWRHVKAVFQAAVERPEAEREAYLASATGGDEALRREVESLLAADGEDAPSHVWLPAAGAALDHGLIDSSASSQPATSHRILGSNARVGSYDIVELVGSGGMGEVYRARDTRLNRDVALKVLLPSLARDPDRIARFKREAQMLAAVAHPHIGAIYGFEDSGGVQALVLELVEGPTLADRIARGPMSPDEAVTIGSQIAEALGAAHAKGILHRDLKPANVKFDASGAVKVLDFGLAKPAGPDDSRQDPGVTRDGVILGTAAYMSPEQACGQAVGTQTDIWSFGCVLFEMLAGRAAFGGASLPDTLAQVLAGEPDWPLLPASTPPRLRDLIRRCLQKNARGRPRDITEVGTELREARSTTSIEMREPEAAWAPRTKSRARRATLVLAVSGMAAVGAAVVAWIPADTAEEAPSAAVHTKVTFAGNIRDAAISPDGRRIAYVSEDADTERLMVQEVSGGAAVEVSPGPAAHPRWSRTGDWLAYVGAGIDVVSASGGEVRHVAPGSVFSWSPEGTHIAAASPNEGGFRVVSLTGEEVGRVALPGIDRLEDLDWNPRSGLLALLTVDDVYRGSIWTVAPDGSELRLLYSGNTTLVSPRWSAAGDALYFQRGRNNADLVRMPDIDGGTDPQVLLSGLQAAGRLTLSTDGALLHTRGLDYSNLWIAGLSGADSVPRRITEGTSDYWAPQVSPDGRWVVTGTGAGSNDTIAKLPLAGGSPTPLTVGASQADNSPAWSPDGTEILFASDRGGVPGLWIMNADGGHQRRLETSEVGTSFMAAWTPEGHVAWQQPTPGGLLNYRIRDLATGREEFLIEDPGGSVYRPVFSPQRDRVAVMWNRRDRPGVWALTWPGRIGRHLGNAGAMPVGWSPDGSWIYAVRSGGRHVLRISAETGDARVVATFPAGGLHSCHVTPDGRHAVCAVREYNGDAWLVENFDPALRPHAR